MHRVRDVSGGALGSARRPELAQLLSEFLACRRPVGADVIAQLLDVTLQIELVLLEPGDIELLSRGATLELAGNVLLVVAYDPVREDARSVIRVFASLFLSPKARSDGRERFASLLAYLVMIPVVLTPSVRWVTRNLPCCLIGA